MFSLSLTTADWKRDAVQHNPAQPLLESDDDDDDDDDDEFSKQEKQFVLINRPSEPITLTSQAGFYSLHLM